MTGGRCRNGQCGRVCESWRQGARSGYCARCARRWADHGYPAGGPPPPRMGTGPKSGRVARIEDYRFLKRRGLSRAESALRMDITKRTIERYEQRLQAGGRQAS